MDDLTTSMNNLIVELLKKYTSTNFIYKNEEYFLRLIYDNRELIDDESFFDFVYDLADKYLSYENNLRLAVTYDYLEEIKSLEKIDYTKEIKIEGINRGASANNLYEFNYIEKMGSSLKSNNDLINITVFLSEINHRELETVKLRKKISKFIAKELVVEEPIRESFHFRKESYIKEKICFN